MALQRFRIGPLGIDSRKALFLALLSTLSLLGQSCGCDDLSALNQLDPGDALDVEAPPDEVQEFNESPALCVSPNAINFGDVPVDSLRVESVTVTNCGNVELELDAPNFLGDAAPFAIVNPGTGTLSIGQSVNVNISFQPREPGVFQRTGNEGARFSTSLSPAPTAELEHYVELFGRGIASEDAGPAEPGDRCVLEVAPSGSSFSLTGQGQRDGTLNFGRVGVDLQTTLPVTVTNVGSGACRIEQVQWDNPANTLFNEFKMLNDAGEAIDPLSLPSVELAPGEQKIYQVSFQPTRTIDGGLLDVISFGSYSGDNSLDNFDGNACSLIPGGFGNPGTMCNGLGIYTNAVEVDSAFGGGYFSIGFNATPVQAQVEVVPNPVDFGDVAVGCSSRWQQVSIYNTSDSPVVIGQPTLDPDSTNPSDFEIRHSSNAQSWPHTIGVAGVYSFEVRAVAQDLGDRFASVLVSTFENGQEAPGFTIPVQARGVELGPVTDVFNIPNRPVVDILFVVDDSGSMSDDQEAMANNFNEFFEVAGIDETDYHIAVTTTLSTEANCIDDFGNLTCDLDPSCGLITACPGNPRFISRESNNPEGEYTCNIQVSGNGNVSPLRPKSDEAEAALVAAKEFLSPPRIYDPSENGGFLRKGGKLEIVAVADERDQSPGSSQLYIDFFQHSISDSSSVRFSAISTGINLHPTVCRDPAHYEDEEVRRYQDVVLATGGSHTPICLPNWQNTMREIGERAAEPRTRFALSQEASPTSVTACVTQNGETTCESRDVNYDTENNAGVFELDLAPEPNSQVSISYNPLCIED